MTTPTFRRAPKPEVSASRAPIPAGQTNTAAHGANGTIRLNKRMAELRLCSRREADAWIERGWVKVNGQPAQMGMQVGPDDRITVERAAQNQQQQQVTILLHKPMGYVSGQAEDGHAPAVTLWGTGAPRREFLHADDFAEACAVLLDRYESDQLINVGVGEDVTIRELAELIREIVGYPGRIEWDTAQPDGTPRKLLEVSRIHALGWRAQIPLADGIRRTYEWYLANGPRA